jgi:hypothetical protein
MTPALGSTNVGFIHVTRLSLSANGGNPESVSTGGNSRLRRGRNVPVFDRDLGGPFVIYDTATSEAFATGARGIGRPSRGSCAAVATRTGPP